MKGRIKWLGKYKWSKFCTQSLIPWFVSKFSNLICFRISVWYLEGSFVFFISCEVAPGSNHVPTTYSLSRFYRVQLFSRTFYAAHLSAACQLGFFTFIRPVSIFFHPEKPYSGSDQLSILTFLFLSRSFLRARGNICIQETPNVLCLWVLSACNFSRTS